MRVAANLHRQRRGKPVVILPQLDPAFHGQGDQLAAGFLVEPGVGRMRDVLLHDGRVDRDACQAVAVDRAGFAPRLDGFG